jgi:hypothetical protein
MHMMAEFFPWNYELRVIGPTSLMQMLVYLCNTPTTPGLMVIFELSIKPLHQDALDGRVLSLEL